MFGGSIIFLVLVLMFAVGVGLVIYAFAQFGQGENARGLACAIPGALLVVVAATVALAAMAGHKGGDRRTGCMGNLAHIGKAATLYAIDHQGDFPPNLSTTTNVVCKTPKLFVCASSVHLQGSLSNVDEWTDYVYVSGLKSNDMEGCVLAFCPPENHDGKGGYVLYVDATTEWLSLDEFVARTSNPALFFATTNAAALAEIQSRAKILRGTKPIPKKWWQRRP